MTPVNHECIYENEIQNHTVELTELKTKSKYKEQSIMEIKNDLKDANDKLDALTDKFNEVIRKSETSDTKLENRVALIETKLELYEQFFHDLKENEDKRKEDGDKRTKNIIAICAVIATIIGILVSLLIKFI